jgi:hypothetical protein
MQRFLSLQWYDQTIEFVFRFVAKTSEPLLAAGLTVSAADYLSHGAVMSGHPAFSLGWSWAQAVALESCSGVVFTYALIAFRQSDRIKAWLYLVLALLLAIVGGGMLLMQVNAVTMGSTENAVPVLNVLRVVVSISYIFLLRAKNIRFTDLADTSSSQVAGTDVGTDERLRVAYQELSTQGKVTVAALAMAAHVRKSTAVEWLRTIEQSATA